MTIDEFIPSLYESSEMTISSELRWPLLKDPVMDPSLPIDVQQVPSRELVRASIRLRDYYMVKQSDVVVAYRPTYGRSFHEGVLTELHFAYFLRKRTLCYVPRKEMNEMILTYCECFHDENELLEKLIK